MKSTIYLSLIIGLFLINQLFAINVKDLGFGGRGERETKSGNYRYQFSEGFQKQICNRCEDSNCWGAQGISTEDNYITRSFYQKGTSIECDGNDENGNPMSEYIAISIGKKDSSTYKYSNILVKTGYPVCHAGDMVMRKINGIYVFFIACTNNVRIFDETAIVKDTKTVNGKKFYYYVSEDKVISRSHNYGSIKVGFSWISKHYGHDNEYITGSYSKTSTSALNFKIVKIDPNQNYAIYVVKSFTVASSVALKVQGATIVGDYVYLTTSTKIRRCTMINDVINSCYEQCSIPRPCDEVLQGAETDANNDLYIGTEFATKRFLWAKYGTDTGCESPFFEINDVLNGDESGSCWQDIDPFDNIQQPPQPYQLPASGVEYRFDYQTIGFMLLVVATIFTTGMSCYICCSRKKGKNVHYQFVKVVSDSEV